MNTTTPEGRKAYFEAYRDKNKTALNKYAKDYRKRKKGLIVNPDAKINTQRLIENRGEYLRRKVG